MGSPKKKKSLKLIENSTGKFHQDVDIGRSKLGSGKERKSESSGLCGWDEIRTTGFPHRTSREASRRNNPHKVEAISLSNQPPFFDLTYTELMNSRPAHYPLMK
jgi:hypothetical protein